LQFVAAHGNTGDWSLMLEVQLLGATRYPEISTKLPSYMYKTMECDVIIFSVKFN
jgi:hypothetical protein